MKKLNKDRLLAGTIVAGASVLGLVGPAFAQDAATTTDDEEAIVVTGSRIAHANVTAPTAVTTVDSETIEYSGEANLADILQGVPSFGVPALSSGNSNFFTTNNGINSLQLRNLGENRTLTLVNGRRWVPGTPGASFVDFNTIPVDLLDRVEVITGGASAIYGADALAGVINVILKDDFEGLQYRYQYGQSEEGDDVDQRFSVLAGGNFADGRGNAVVNFVYSRNDGVMARDRDETQLDFTARCSTTGVPADCQTPVYGAFSTYSASGLFFNQTGPGAFSVNGSNAAVPYTNAGFGFNRQQYRRYSVPNQRFMLSGLFNYEINPAVEAFAETMFSYVSTEANIEPTPYNYSSASVPGIPCSNPYVPATLYTKVCSSGQTAIPFRRRMLEVGTRGGTANRSTFRILTGLRGDFGDGAYNWETYYAYGRNDSLQKVTGAIYNQHFRNAIDASDDGFGNITCNDPVARAGGCVPINIFGFGSISQAAADYVNANSSRTAFSTQEVAGATINGPLFAMPAGDVNFAAGAEWRREVSEDRPDALTQAGETSSNKEGVTGGGYSVGELFAEVEVPLLRDLPLIQELTFGAAYRWSDYSVQGQTEAYSARLQWQITDWLRARAQYARAVRVPNIGELFGPAGENFAGVVDPCNGVTEVDVPGDTDNICRSIAVINNRINAEDLADDGLNNGTGNFTLTLAEQQGTGGFTGGGNTGLAPELSDSYNVGLVLDHDFGSPGTITASLDFWRIELTQQIAVPTRQSQVDTCYDVALADFPTAACAFVVRDTTGLNPLTLGEIEEVNSTFSNFSDVTYFSGVDLSILWGFSLSDWFGSAPGDVQLRMNWGHAISTQADNAGDDGLTGEIENPQDRIQFGAIYSVGPATFSWESNWVSDVTQDTPGPAGTYNVGDYLTHDVRLGWDVNERTNLYVGSNNVTDEDAPIVLLAPFNTTGTLTDASQYDPIGRTFYAGIRLRY